MHQIATPDVINLAEGHELLSRFHHDAKPAALSVNRRQVSILLFRFASKASASCSFSLTMKASANLPTSGMGTLYSASKTTSVSPFFGRNCQVIVLSIPPLVLLTMRRGNCASVQPGEGYF